MATIRKRSRAESGITDGTCTPLWLAEILPEVDFDPCSNARAHIKCGWSFGLHKGIDGLKMPWRGRGFINWPFSYPDPWVTHMLHEFAAERCTEMIVLCKHDPSTAWWQRLVAPHPITEATPELWTFNKRLEYEEAPEIVEQRRIAHEEGLRKREEAKAVGASKEVIAKIKVPPLETSNNFASCIVHHRGFDGKRLMMLESVATLWVQP